MDNEKNMVFLKAITDVMLTIKNISRSYGEAGTESHRPVLQDLDLEMKQGERLSILGPSGSGKTTLLNLIGGLDRTDSGSLVFRGKDLTAFSPEEMDEYRNSNVGFVFQFHHLLPQCTLLENILIPSLVNRERKDGAEERARALMEKVGIWQFRDRLPGKLSGGECQRGAVVRAMINRPSILLADEPTGALDRENVEAMAELLLELNREEELALIVVTHSASLAGKIGNIHELREGKLVKV